jgi:hypothetical protein
VDFQQYIRPISKLGTNELPSQIEKLEAHASHLLDAFIGLRERYEMLDPMLFHEQVPKLRGSGTQARGYMILRHSLFLSCAQDIAKLSLDDDKRTPSIRNLMDTLADSNLRDELRETFANWHSPSIEVETDPKIIDALKQMEIREEAEQRSQFDDLYSQSMAAWTALSTSSFMDGFLTIRDKVSAHTEVQYVADRYQFIDIGSLGIKWVDMRRAIELMQSLVALLGLLIRNAGFAWNVLDEQLSRASNAFWLHPEVLP